MGKENREYKNNVISTLLSGIDLKAIIHVKILI